MTMMKKSNEKKDEKDRTADEKGMLSSYENPVDFSKKEKIGPLITYVQSLKK
jgi:hypothetical protein